MRRFGTGETGYDLHVYTMYKKCRGMYDLANSGRKDSGNTLPFIVDYTSSDNRCEYTLGGIHKQCIYMYMYTNIYLHKCGIYMYNVR